MTVLDGPGGGVYRSRWGSASGDGAVIEGIVRVLDGPGGGVTGVYRSRWSSGSGVGVTLGDGSMVSWSGTLGLKCGSASLESESSSTFIGE